MSDSNFVYVYFSRDEQAIHVYDADGEFEDVIFFGDDAPDGEPTTEREAKQVALRIAKQAAKDLGCSYGENW